jgi:hypothetical protein
MVPGIMIGSNLIQMENDLATIDAALDNDCQLYGIQTATNTTAPGLN